MKRKDDPRHQKRRQLAQQLFAYSFHPQANKNIASIIKKFDQINPLIQQCAPEWPINQINKIDLAILRLAIYELMLQKEPKKVIIDEAVELAKELGSDSSPKFVNGALGCVTNQLAKKT
jgi:N utilization substance protein B